MLQIYKQFIHPLYQYEILVYGVASRPVLNILQGQQNFFLRFRTLVTKQPEGRTIHTENSKCSILELHVYEVLKLATKILRSSLVSQKLYNSIAQLEID